MLGVSAVTKCHLKKKGVKKKEKRKKTLSRVKTETGGKGKKEKRCQKGAFWQHGGKKRCGTCAAPVG
jgi:hypothetical protein